MMFAYIAAENRTLSLIFKSFKNKHGIRVTMAQIDEIIVDENTLVKTYSKIGTGIAKQYKKDHDVKMFGQYIALEKAMNDRNSNLTIGEKKLIRCKFFEVHKNKKHLIVQLFKILENQKTPENNEINKIIEKMMKTYAEIMKKIEKTKI